MAQAFLKRHAPDVDSFSAGTRPAVDVNPIVVQVMNEVGIDISQNRPKALSDDMISDSILVSMGCMDREACPVLSYDSIEWNIPDPGGKTVEQVREIRDCIESKIKELISRMEQ